MKTYLTILVLLWSAGAVLGQTTADLLGAWQQDRHGNQHILIFTDGYWSFVSFNIQNKEFVGTMGGAYSLANAEILPHQEFNTLNDYMPLSGTIEVSANTLQIGTNTWQRVDDGTPGALQGAWLITGRERDGIITTRPIQARKTMKILSGTRFQWIAYNSETREFRGTGGGIYTTIDGKYTETIEFFSRDSSRVGASLDFEFELIDGAWHHKGKSSKGELIHEIWSKRKD